MNILLVFPKINYVNSDNKRKKELLYKLFGEAVSLTLPQVAASTPKGHKIEIIDESSRVMYKMFFIVFFKLI